MVAALVRVQFDLDGSGAFVDPPADRVIGDIRAREGRNVTRLGGPDIPAQCTAVTLVLNNHDGYYTTGAGMTLGPGSRMRVQWKAQTADAWVTRFQGSLSELSIRFEGFSFALTRWVGPLYRFTSGNIPERLIINQTPQSIMGVLADAAGVPANDREFDTEATRYSRQLSPGYSGVQEVQAMLRGFIYDAPEGKVRLELLATRQGKSTVARYTDGDPTAAEIPVPPPRRLTRPFGIINAVHGEYQYITPSGQQGETRTVTLPEYVRHLDNRHEPYQHWWPYNRTVILPFTPSPSVQVLSWDLDFGTRAHDVDGSGVNPFRAAVSGVTGATFMGTYRRGSTMWTFVMRNLVMTVSGNSLCISGETRHFYDSVAGPFNFDLAHNGTVTISDIASFDQTITTFERIKEDAGSINLYGYRPRLSPLVIGVFQSTPLADTFTPNYDALDAAIQSELHAYAAAIPVFEIELNTGTFDNRADLLARRLSDRVHLTADGPSKLGFDDDGFIEAIQTRIAPTGEITQQIYIQRTRLPAVVSDLALGAQSALTMTQGVAFSVTLPAATGGTPPYTYSVTGEPPGLTFDDQARVLSGTPT